MFESMQCRLVLKVVYSVTYKAPIRNIEVSLRAPPPPLASISVGGGMVLVGSRSIVRLGLAVLLVAPSDGFIARGVCATRACRASCGAPPALAVAPPRHIHRSEGRSAESTGDAGTGSFGRTLSALALALMLTVSPGPGALPAFADPAIADPVPACKEFASSCRVASGQPAKGTDQPETALAAATRQGAPAKAASRRYINLSGFPFHLGAFTERRTVATELVPGRVYGFEQAQMRLGITANVRSA